MRFKCIDLENEKIIGVCMIQGDFDPVGTELKFGDVLYKVVQVNVGEEESIMYFNKV